MPLPSHDLIPPIRFGPFEFDEAAFRLRRDGANVSIEPKALSLLQLLIAAAPRVVDKGEIFAEIWKDVAVTDNALTRAVAQLRKALDDDPKSPRYIETVATRGYRWIAPLEAAPAITSATAADVAAPNADVPAERPARHLPAIVASVALVALLAAAWVAWRTPDDAPSAAAAFPDAATLAALRPAQLSSGARYEGYLAFAPDGRSFAFSSDRSGALEIYVQGVAPGSVAAALTNNGRQNVQPAWSPDGQFIAFHEMAGNGIWVMPSRGGVPRKVSDFGSRPSWSPDGTHLVFQMIPVTQVNALGVPGVLGTIWTVDVAGGAPPVEITKPGIPEGPHLNPAWFDGNRLIFAAGQDGDDTLALWIVPASGGSPRLLARHPRLGVDYLVAPDKRRIFFVARTTNAIWQLPLSDAGAPEGEPVPTGLATVGAFIGNLTMSADGRTIGWTSMEITGHVWAREGDTASASPVLTALTQGAGVRYTNPTPAGDGRVLLNGIRPGAGFSVFLLDAGGEPRALVQHGPGHGGAQWLPGDREVITFTDHRELSGDPGPAVFALDVATGRERRLFGMEEVPTPPGAQATSGPPAANMIFNRNLTRAFTVHVKDGRPNIWTLGLRDARPDGSLSQMTFEEGGASYPVLSPDDRWLAYQCGQDTDMHVCVMELATGTRTQLTHEPGQSWVGGWGSDNDTIFFAARRQGVWNIAAVSRTTGESRMLTNYTDATTYVRYPKWDVAHHRVLFERSEATGRTWAVTLPAS